MFAMKVFRPCLPIACRISSRFICRDFHLVNVPLRINRNRTILSHSRSNLFNEQYSNCFLTSKVLFNTNSPVATKAKQTNDANESPENNKRLSSKRRRIISESTSTDDENGTQDVNRKSESVIDEIF